MKKTALLLLILAVIAGAMYYLKPSDKRVAEKQASYGIEGRDIALENTEDITAITIQKGSEPGYLLEKKSNGWYINKKYRVSDTKLPQLMKVFKHIQVNEIPHPNAIPQIKEYMKYSAIKVKLYDSDNKVMRSFSIGPETTQKGTIFMLDGYDSPYYMHIKGFDGLLRSRFLQPIDNWRDQKFFNFDANDIASISLQYHRNERQSFHINNTNPPTVKPLSSFIQENGKSANVNKTKAYIDNFSGMYVEAYDNTNPKRDSFMRNIPFATLTLTQKNGEMIKARFLPFIDLIDDEVQINQSSDSKQVDHFFIDIEGGDFIVAQQQQIEKIFVPLDYFY